MTMARPLPYLLALLLGVGAALLVACGGGTKGGLPAASAGELKSQLQDVEQAVDDHRCEDVSGQLRQVDTNIDQLPGSVDERLRERLRQASDRLHQTALKECNVRETTTTTTPTNTQTETTNTQTDTVPTQTQTQTQTLPPATTTTPPVPTTTQPAPPPVTPPVQPPVQPPVVPPPPPAGGTPGGGATPEVQP
jgi:hypothetical protein